MVSRKRMSRRLQKLDAARKKQQKNTPETIATAERILKEAKDAGVEVFTKTYRNEDLAKAAINAMRHTGGTTTVNDFGEPDYSRDPAGRPVALVPNPILQHGDIAKSLLNAARWKSHAGPLAPPFSIEDLKLDDRPIIDVLHEATFTKPIGLACIQDEYALRMTLRKAHCFTLDEATSAMVADFSLATAANLEAARQLAIPPFPVTWVELNNHARLKRMRELQAPLHDTDPNNPPCARIGWLIHPNLPTNGWWATYVTIIECGVWVAPLSYYWHAGTQHPTPDEYTDAAKYVEWLAFGTAGNVHGSDAFLYPSNLHIDVTKATEEEGRGIKDVMKELAGELRHIWGFLIALGAGHLGANATYTAQPKPTSAPPIMKNGKPLLPLEHKILHLHLGKKQPQKIVAQAITHHHNRWHEVRAHWRTLKSGKRVPVKSHPRGDQTLGRIEKTYRVER